MFEFKLPDLGEGIHEAEILKWHLTPGETIGEDEPLVDVETDKAAVTIPSPRGGVLKSVAGGEGEVVVVGQVIAIVDDGVEDVPSAGQSSSSVEVQAAPDRQTVAATPATLEVRRGVGPVPAAPATRRLARELGVDITAVPPTGPGGRVTPEDIERFAGATSTGRTAQRPAATPERAVAIERSQEATPQRRDPTAAGASGAPIIPFFELEPMPDFERWGPVERESLRSIRRKIARKMVTSLVVVPHVIHMDEADVSALEAFRYRYREKNPEAPKLSLLAFVVKAITAGLRRAPMFNASLDPDRAEIVYKHYYNIGLAADTPRGLIVPVVREADRKSVLDIAKEIKVLAEQARAGQTPLEVLQGGTFTITNIGPLGGIALAPAINYPEAAILGMGKVQEKPVVRDGEIVIRKMLPLTLSFDHRVADGGDAARFVSHVIHLLSDLDNLLLEV